MGLKKVISSQGVTVDIVCKSQDALFNFFCICYNRKVLQGWSFTSLLYWLQSAYSAVQACIIRTMQRLKTFRSSEVFCSHLELRGAAHFSFSEKSWEFSPTRGVGGRLLYQLLVKFQKNIICIEPVHKCDETHTTSIWGDISSFNEGLAQSHLFCLGLPLCLQKVDRKQDHLR